VGAWRGVIEGVPEISNPRRRNVGGLTKRAIVLSLKTGTATEKKVRLEVRGGLRGLGAFKGGVSARQYSKHRKILIISMEGENDPGMGG